MIKFFSNCRRIEFWLLCLLSLFVCCKNKTRDTNRIIISDPLLTISDSLYSYKDKAYTGLIVSESNDKQTKVKLPIYKGQIDGLFQEWFADGTLKTTKSYRRGKEHGEQKGFHHNGLLSYSYTAHKNHRTGLYQEFYPNGQLQIAKEYKKGEVVKTKILTIDGQVIANYLIKDGRTYGPIGSQDCISVVKANG